VAHPLDGARLKIVRAQEHLDAFKAEAGAFVNTHPYRFESEVYGEHWWVKPHIIAQPPLRLSAIVGDCVTNARAAIDYIVWELAVKYFVPAVDLRDRNDRRITAFPIFEHSVSEQGYADRIDRLKRRQVPAAALRDIAAQQPDVSGDQALWWLHELVNSDKHRTPVLTLSVFGEAQIGIKEYKGKAWVIRSPIIKDGAAIKAEPEFLAAIKSGDVKVDVDASVYVACEDVSMPANRWSGRLSKSSNARRMSCIDSSGFSEQDSICIPSG
jgi:hypothetical protein